MLPSNQFHTMPIQFGPIVGDTRTEFTTKDKTDVTIQLEVAAEAARSLLPTWIGSDGKTYGYRALPMGPTGEPLLFVNYTQERDVDYMAGRGYNEVEFYLSAEFTGEKVWQHKGSTYRGAYGMFAVLLLPSDPIPLIVGREVMGTPKHLADVKDLVLGKIFTEDEGLCGSFQVHDVKDEPFLAGLVRNVRPIPSEVLGQPMPAHTPLPPKDGWGRCDTFEPDFSVMLWKYVAAANWAEAQPDLSYSVGAYLGDVPTTELSDPMGGDGNVVFLKSLDVKDHPGIAGPLAALRNVVENHSRPFPGNVLIRNYSNAYRSQDLHIMDGPRLPAER
jgi:hypothetical protein